MKLTGTSGAFAAIWLIVCMPGAASAADDPSHPYGKDILTLGVGGALIPVYDGAAKVRFSPAWAIRGQVSGFYFSSFGTNFYLDLIREAPDKVDLQLGPVFGTNGNRTGHTGVAAVDALGKRDTAIELGGFIGIGKNGVLLGKFDSVSVRVTYQVDVAGAHKSYTISPGIRYGTALSKRDYVGMSASADIVGGDYARYYFAVTPEGAAASGLPRYTLGGGLKSFGAKAFVGHALGRKLSKGWAIFAAGGYTRMLGDFRRSPIVAIAGNPDAFLGAVGVGYTF